jgi:GT2 family glycosyltransferase
MIPLMAGEETSFDLVDSPPPSPTGVHNSAIPDGVPDRFDEIAYLEAYPDIAKAVRSGEWTSGLHHYRVHGAREDRLADQRYLRALSGCTASFPPGWADRALITAAGHCLVSGWALDTDDAPMRQIAVRQNGLTAGVTTSIARCRRLDTEQSEPRAVPGLWGFWALVDLDPARVGAGDIDVLITAGQERGAFTVRPLLAIGEQELRDDALRTLINAKYFNDPETESFLQLDKGIGKTLIHWNTTIVERIAKGAYQMRFGERRALYLGSIVVVLFGNPDFLTLQAALFSQCPGYDEYEFIYISNSPELNDILVRDATNASRIYGVAITLILLPGNAGFGVANNVAAAAAETDRLIFLNPDVLPRETDWPRLHAELVAALPAAQTALFGVPLYYGDGALMHGGMYIDLYGGCSIQNGRVLRREILRVEHYGKGALPRAPQYVGARPVPAVSGAFISVDRAWFEKLGGFSPEFIFGHYEDVDLCLRSFEAGVPAWLHDIPFWHLESVGSNRAPQHDGGRLVNRWHLTEKWGSLVRSELNGRSPAPFEG